MKKVLLFVGFLLLFSASKIQAQRFDVKVSSYRTLMMVGAMEEIKFSSKMEGPLNVLYGGHVHHYEFTQQGDGEIVFEGNFTPNIFEQTFYKVTTQDDSMGRSGGSVRYKATKAGTVQVNYVVKHNYIGFISGQKTGSIKLIIR